jgi:hypothetical protein
MELLAFAITWFGLVSSLIIYYSGLHSNMYTEAGKQCCWWERVDPGDCTVRLSQVSSHR